jgi:hypothetical protein
MSLQRLVLTFTQEGVEIRTLYRTKNRPNPGTKVRRREVSNLVRTGLQDTLETLDTGDVDMVGTSGYDVREDILVAEIHRRRKGGAA